jgi:hypothetical protein
VSRHRRTKKNYDSTVLKLCFISYGFVLLRVEKKPGPLASLFQFQYTIVVLDGIMDITTSSFSIKSIGVEEEIGKKHRATNYQKIPGGKFYISRHDYNANRSIKSTHL